MDIWKRGIIAMASVTVLMTYILTAITSYNLGRKSFHEELIQGVYDYESAIIYMKDGKIKILSQTDEPTGSL